MTLPGLVDTHCHLTLGALAEQAAEAWQRARQNGVVQAVVIGIDGETSRQALEFVTDRNGLSASVGIHPNSTAKVTSDEFDNIVALADAPDVVAIGETGVDLYRRHSDLATQRRSLEQHAELALEKDLPLVLHIRDAYAEAAEILEPYAARGVRAVVHCFTGRPENLSPYLEWGFCIAFGGVLTYPNAPEVREAAARVPLGQCLVETDAPWLAPVPHRGKINEPAYVVHTAAELARIHGVTDEEMAQRTSANARRLFRLPLP